VPRRRSGLTHVEQRQSKLLRAHTKEIVFELFYSRYTIYRSKICDHGEVHAIHPVSHKFDCRQGRTGGSASRRRFMQQVLSSIAACSALSLEPTGAQATEI
jgi:hypothetical protein